MLASDGVWDVLSHEKVASLAKRQPNARAAAKAICDAAKKERLYGGHFPDDISALVVNLGSRPGSGGGLRGKSLTFGRPGHHRRTSSGASNTSYGSGCGESEDEGSGSGGERKAGASVGASASKP